MHIELIDTLRCPNPHEDSWLVGAFDRVIDRDIVEGRLGCPMCGSTYEIRGGVVQFDEAEDSTGDGAPAPVGADDALRLAAMLDLASPSPGGLVILEGAWARAGDMLETFIDARLLLMNPPAGLVEHARMSGVRSRRTIPVAAGSARGIALHRATHGDALATAAVRALRPGGRLVAPVDRPLPPDVQELARDDQWWVAERSAPPALVTLGRR